VTANEDVPLPVTVKPVVVPRVKLPWLTERVKCCPVPDVPAGSVTLIVFPPVKARVLFWLTLTADGTVIAGGWALTVTVMATLAVAVRLVLVSSSDRLSESEPL
jgi:hypothetical protein